MKPCSLMCTWFLGIRNFRYWGRKGWGKCVKEKLELQLMQLHLVGTSSSFHSTKINRYSSSVVCLQKNVKPLHDLVWAKLSLLHNFPIEYGNSSWVPVSMDYDKSTVVWTKDSLVFFIFELRPDSESLWKSTSDEQISLGDKTIFLPKKLP